MKTLAIPVAGVLLTASGAGATETLELTLSSAVSMALERSLALKIEEAEPLLAAIGVRQAQAEFSPYLNSSVDWFDGSRYLNNVLETSPDLENGTIDERGWNH